MPDMNKTLLYGLSPSRWAEDCLSFVGDPWQRDILDSGHRRIIANCCRQSGKSCTVGILLLHTALFRAPSMSIVISPSLAQSSEMTKRIKGFLSDLPLDARPRLTKDTESRIEFDNGSRIIGLPGSSISSRGYSAVDILCCDEASRIDPEIYYAVRPVVATVNGKVILLSTPAGRTGFFADTWFTGENWHKIQVTGEECPRISKEFLLEERASMGARVFSQEYSCSFSESSASVFTHAQIEALIDDQETELPEFQELSEEETA